MTTTIQPIETRYAGCRFRSRLEARWAVFFDAADIRWEYEPEGYTLGDGTRYLPDFYLPESGTWIEVKGTDSALDVDLMSRASAELPGARLMILGPIPPPLPTWDVGMYSNGDYGWSTPTVGGGNWLHGFGNYDKDGRPWGLVSYVANASAPVSVTPAVCEDDYAHSRIIRAYATARSARFEHGEGTERVKPVPYTRPRRMQAANNENTKGA